MNVDELNNIVQKSKNIGTDKDRIKYVLNDLTYIFDRELEDDKFEYNFQKVLEAALYGGKTNIPIYLNFHLMLEGEIFYIKGQLSIFDKNVIEVITSTKNIKKYSRYDRFVLRKCKHILKNYSSILIDKFNNEFKLNVKSTNNFQLSYNDGLEYSYKFCNLIFG